MEACQNEVRYSYQYTRGDEVFATSIYMLQEDIILFKYKGRIVML